MSAPASTGRSATISSASCPAPIPLRAASCMARIGMPMARMRSIRPPTGSATAPWTMAPAPRPCSRSRAPSRPRRACAVGRVRAVDRGGKGPARRDLVCRPPRAAAGHHGGAVQPRPACRAGADARPGADRRRPYPAGAGPRPRRRGAGAADRAGGEYRGGLVLPFRPLCLRAKGRAGRLFPRGRDLVRGGAAAGERERARYNAECYHQTCDAFKPAGT